MYRICIPALPPTLNQYYAGVHWSKRKKDAEEWHLRFGMAFKEAKLPERLKWPITVNCTLYAKRQPRDADGAVMAVKFAQDALVEYGYLPNDSPEYISTVILSSKKAEDKKEKTVLLIE